MRRILEPTLRRLSALSLMFSMMGMMAVCALVCLPAAASASSIHEFGGSFGAASSTPANPYPLSEPTGVAVNSSGDVYVADTLNFRVEEFDAGGKFVLMFGKEVDKTTKADVCTAASGDTCQPGVDSAAGEGGFAKPVYVAVDDSGGASQGDVYVGDDSTQTVYKFAGDGHFLSKLEASFGRIEGVAVDRDGDVWVYDQSGSTMSEYSPEGALTQSWSSGFGTPQQLFAGIAVDGETHLYFSRGIPLVDEFSETGSDFGGLAETLEIADGLAYNRTTDDLYLNAGNKLETFRPKAASCNPQASPCAPTDTFGSEQLKAGVGLAVNEASNTVYSSEDEANTVERFVVGLEASTKPAEGIEPHAGMLVGMVNPEGREVTECFFEYGPTEGYGSSVPCEPSPGNGNSPVTVKAAISGLSPGAATHFRLVVRSSAGVVHGDDLAFDTLPVPILTNLEAKNVTATSADLTATVSTSSLATKFHFELEGHAFAAGTIEGSVASAAVTQHVTGLAPNTTYHWRLVASNPNGVTESADQTFVYETAGHTLPDRQYEMVTPPQKNGALIGDFLIGLGAVLSESGERLIVDSIQGFAGTEGGSGNRFNQGEPYAFTRSAAGWLTTPQAPPQTEFESNTPEAQDANTGYTLYSIPTPAGSVDHFFKRSPTGELADLGPVSAPEGGPKGADPFTANGVKGTANLSHILWQDAEGQFSSDAGGGVSLYEYAGTNNTQPTLVGVSGGPGSHSLISACGIAAGGLGTLPTVNYNSISEDGGTVFFTALACTTGTGENTTGPGEGEDHTVPNNELFARIDQSETVAISAKSAGDCTTAPCTASPVRAAEYAGAGQDGKRVYFTSTQQLTNEAAEDTLGSDSAAKPQGGCVGTTGANGCNLYLYDFTQSDSQHRLIDVSAGDTSGQGPRVRGVVAISADGSHVYFVAQGILTGTANAFGAKALSGQENLYVYERAPGAASGTMSFVTALPKAEATSSLWNEGVGTANVTPDGRYLVFPTTGRLTPDDTREDGAAQIFKYDSRDHSLIRVSIGQGGFDDNGNDGAGDARITPIRAWDEGIGPVRTDPTMSNDGEYIFFQSPIALVPGALNDVVVDSEGDRAQNIYEYHAGRVSLISDGKDISAGGQFTETLGTGGGRSSVQLIGASGTGHDVIFTTADQLDPSRDTDTQVDYYDARICGSGGCVPAAPPPAVPCAEEATCHGALMAALPTVIPVTVAYTSPGNSTSVTALTAPKPTTTKPKATPLSRALNACHRFHRAAKRRICEAGARKKFAKGKRSQRRNLRKGQK